MTFYTQYTQVRKQARELTKNDKFVAVMKLGDFFEAFDGDAKIVSSVCCLILRCRKVGKHGEKNMAGFPAFSREKYIAALIKAGYTVAVIEYARDVKHGKLLRMEEF